MAHSEASKLLLFDIDGTLLTSNGVGRRLMDEALADLFGPGISSAGIAFSGRTDLEIMDEILRNHGVPDRALAHLVPLALKTYAHVARGRIHPDDLSLLPGVRRLLERLRRHASVQLGLVTGNLQETAYYKLKAAGIASLFPFGAFGSDHADRNLLPPLAAQRARRYNGVTYCGHNIVVIGDSVHDVRCGLHTGALCVAVATGDTPPQKLAATGPHLLMKDFTDADTFCAVTLGMQLQSD